MRVTRACNNDFHWLLSRWQRGPCSRACINDFHWLLSRRQRGPCSRACNNDFHWLLSRWHVHAITISIGCCQGDSGGPVHMHAVTIYHWLLSWWQRGPCSRACNNDFHWLLSRWHVHAITISIGCCQGDSGGPVHVGNTVVGLASFVASGCLVKWVECSLYSVVLTLWRE